MIGKAIKLKPQYIILCAFVFIILTIILMQREVKEESVNTLVSRKLSDSSNSYVKFTQDDIQLEDESELPVLKEHANQVPICIVDEHNEVIPYWYKAVDEGIIKSKGNTLIHIDGHSDMATPSQFKALYEFKHRKNAHEISFLPLMQANDDFIVSAIMKGLINNVVWVIPSWNDASEYTTLYKSYVGVTRNKNNNEKTVCDCQRETRSKSEMKCLYIDREAEKEEDIEVSVKPKDCKKLRPFTFITVSENKFIKLVNLKKNKNIFVDIDEDYFGVQSGVKDIVDEGISLDTLGKINQVLYSLYCPESVELEQILNTKVRNLFAFISTLGFHSQEDRATEIAEQIHSQTSKYFCVSHKKYMRDIVLTAVELYSSMNETELVALSKMKYCLSNSPRLHSERSMFQLCHGTIYPEDTLNQIYVGNEEEIKTRGKQITNMINFIYNHTQTRFFTIARSLRDGYTPRHQQRLIESVLLESLDEAISKQGKQKKVIYDKELVFGKRGWTS